MFTAKGMIAFAMAGLAMIFLSSVVPVAASEDVFKKGAPPIEHTQFDISKELHPWIDIMVAQLAIGVYDQLKAAEEAEAEAVRRLANADKFVWDLSGWTFVVMGFLAIALTGIIGFATLKRLGV